MEQSPERSENLYLRTNNNTYVPCGQNVNTKFCFLLGMSSVLN